MAKFQIVVGQPGTGKSLYTADLILSLLKRNKRWHKKSGIKRRIALNMKLSDDFLHKNDGWFIEWSSWEDLLTLRDCDIIWDEISVMLDARKYADLTITQLHWLSHYRKLGLEIYANTQDYSMLDARARIMANRVFEMRKLWGSPDPSATRPPVKRPWGLIIMRRMTNHRDEEALKSPKLALLPSSMVSISKKLISIYDTTQIIEVKDRPLKHIERHCTVCGKVHIAHV